MYNRDYYPYYNYKSNLSNRVSTFAQRSKLNWSNILNATQKTLNIINQAIPIIYQIKPIYNNAKTIFKVINVVKDDKPQKKEIVKTNNNITSNEKKKEPISSSPTFFL